MLTYKFIPSKMSRKRPIGIIIVAFLRILVGLLELAGGSALVAGGGFLGIWSTRFVSEVAFWGSAMGATVAVIGLVFVLFGLLDFIVAWGVWTLRTWAWWIAVLDAGLGMLCPAASLLSGNASGVPVLLFNGIAFAFLLTPEVMQAMDVQLS